MATATESIAIPVRGGQQIEADLQVPHRTRGLIVFAHGSGSSRFSSRNRAVAESLQARGFGTLLLDLLTKQEEAIVPGATHLFEEPGTLEEVERLAGDWFVRYLKAT
jgi:hypothetical protein